MCGIAGVIGEPDAGLAARCVHVMSERMRARGPDGYGEFLHDGVAMAMRRLAIIDLDHGGQPLKSRHGRIIAFQNGEIYNYRELQRELSGKGYEFGTHSDTEVLAHGYDCWGIDELLRRLDGMFALAILDLDARLLHLARDRFGEKPLFYSQFGARFAYCSDLLGIAGLPWLDATIDFLSIERYLALHYTPGKRTVFAHIHRVLPGHRLEVALSDLTVAHHRYYALPVEAQTGNITAEGLEAQVEHAVKSRLVADVPVGIFLSGGLDSSLIAAIAAKHSPGIHTFSMGFASNAHDESEYAKLVAQSVGSTHHHFLFDEASFGELLPRVIQALDEPLGDQAMLPVYWLSREAARVVKVALSGEGADELFAGYNYYRPFAPPTRAQRLRAALRGHAGAPLARLDALIANVQPITPSGFPLLTDRGGRRTLFPVDEPEIDDWERDVIAQLERIRDPLQRATSADVLTWLPDDLLVKSDRMTMANSLEGRAPYLQPELAQSALCALSASRRMSGNTSKVALRQIGKRYLPPLIGGRRKQGFVLPMRRWLAAWLAAHGGVMTYLGGIDSLGIPTTAIRGWLVEQEKVGIDNERLVFALIALIEWLQFAGQSLRAARASTRFEHVN